MRLGKRSSGVGPCGGGQLIALAIWFSIVLGTAARSDPATGGPARPDLATVGATVGPARIVCNASFCEMGSGARPKERFRVIVSDLPQEDIRRLRKCTGVSKPCIVTIEGTERGGPMRITAGKIEWQE